MTTPKQTVRLEVRLTEREEKILDAYCEQEGRTKTDVVRECIRKLKSKVRFG